MLCPMRSRGLILRMIKREVVGRYQGSILGLAWSVFNPLLMLAVYTIVFSTIFQARFSVGSGSKSGFALALFIGLIAHNIIAETLNRSPGLILQNGNYVKKVVFPLEVLPCVMLGATLFAMILHGIWNAGAILTAIGGVRTMLVMPDVDFPGVLMGLFGMSIIGVLILAMLVALFLVNYKLRNVNPVQAEIEPASPVG